MGHVHGRFPSFSSEIIVPQRIAQRPVQFRARRSCSLLGEDYNGFQFSVRIGRPFVLSVAASAARSKDEFPIYATGNRSSHSVVLLSPPNTTHDHEPRSSIPSSSGRFRVRCSCSLLGEDQSHGCPTFPSADDSHPRATLCNSLFRARVTPTSHDLPSLLHQVSSSLMPRHGASLPATCRASKEHLILPEPSAALWPAHEPSSLRGCELGPRPLPEG